MSKAFSNSLGSDQLKTSILPPGYMLLWRQQKLIVRQFPLEQATKLSIPTDKRLLIKCLKRSRVKLVMLDLAFGERILTFWASACSQAGKPVCLRIPSIRSLSSKHYPVYWRLKRAIDWVGAALLLMLLSPVMILLIGLIRLISPGPIVVHHWRVGRRGRLFQLIRFRTTTLLAESRKNQQTEHQREEQQIAHYPYIKLIGYWMQCCKLDRLPQLLNVLRGEMSLVGPRAYTLEDALKMEPQYRDRLNALPGIIGSRQVRSRLSSLNTSDSVKLESLQDQSL